MFYKNTTFFVIVFLLFLNLMLLYKFNLSTKVNVMLKKENTYLQTKNEELLKNIELILFSFDKSVKINNKTLKEYITSQEKSSSLLFINENSCTPCLDVLLCEMEELRIDSLINIENLKLIIIGKNILSRNSGFRSVFDNNYNGHLSVNEEDIEFLDDILLPEIFFMNINNQLKINYIIKFDSRNPDFFNFCLRNIN